MTDAYKKKAVRRLRIAAGQVRGLERMVDAGAYCIDIINQSEAVKQALAAFEDVVLEHHLATHVADDMRTGSVKRAVRELLSVYRAARKK